MLAAAMGLALTSAAFATDFPEVEPNESKAAATVVTGMQPGDTLSGTTTGTSTTVAGVGSIDFFDVTTAAAPSAGIYQYRLVITTGGTAGHTGSIRGLTQTAGVINAGTDTAVQTSSTTSTPPRFVQWYANGTPSRLYFAITGGTTTTSPYTVTLERTAVTPNIVPSAVPAGEVSIYTNGQTTADTDLWVYDANFDAIPGAGNDDSTVAGGAPAAGTQSYLRRTYPAGTYYVAIANYNTANNQPFFPIADENGPVDTVVDFPNVLLTSSTATNADNDFVIANDCAGSSQAITNLRPGIFDVTIWQFTTTGPTLPAQLRFTAGSATPANVVPGNSTTLSVTVNTTSTGVAADLQAFGLSAAEAFSDPENDNTWTYTLNVPGAQAYGAYNVIATAQGGACPGPAPTRTVVVNVIAPPPVNDTCDTALPIMPGVNVAGNNGSATNESPIPPTCSGFSTFNLGVWYTFTPATSNRFIASTCNAGTTLNTRVYVYSGSCAGLTCVGANATASPACTAPANAATVSFCAVAGTTYYILVTNDTTGTGNYELSLTDTGADCTPPANDGCAGALPIAVGQTLIGNSTNATNESPVPSTCNGLSTFNVGMWYTFTEGASARRLNVSTCDANTNYNTRVYVYTGSCGAFTCVNANAVASPACGARADAAAVTFCTLPGTQYFFLVTNDTTGTGTFGISLSDTGQGCTPPPNDDCANAINITSVPFAATAFVDTATPDLDVSCNAAANVQSRAGVWYTYTPGEPGAFRFTETGTADVVFTVFTGPDCASLSEVFCNTDEAGTVAAPAVAGTQYRILVSMASDTAALPASYVLSINYIATSGACCNGTSCTLTAGAAACTGSGGVFQGYGVSCGGGPLPPNLNTTPVAIPDFSVTPAPVSSVINVTDSTVIDDLNVHVKMNHTFIGDIYVRLQGPNGTTVDLIKRPNIVAPCTPGAIGDGDDMVGTYVFDDDAAQTLHAATIDADTTVIIASGHYIPSTCTGTPTSLDAASPAGFGGIPAAGTWTLIVSDEDEAITGTLEEFGIIINGVEAGTPCNATGACCSGSSCSATTSAACTGANTSFSGNGTVCNAAGNYTTPCCKADYNHVGGVTVQDIFDFLNGYFTVNLQADANGNGAVTVQDIFDFLSAYFAGCA